MKAALIEVDQCLTEMGVATHMVNVIHDEIQFDGPLGELDLLHKTVPFLMCETDPITAGINEVVPILVDHEVTVTNWAEKCPYEEFLRIAAFDREFVPTCDTEGL
jgi:DNA polymerase I-like protein with 3'-5' exonuclease and polymerase domains